MTGWTAAIFEGRPGFREVAAAAARDAGVWPRPVEDVRRGGRTLWVVPCSPIAGVILASRHQVARRWVPGDVLVAVIDTTDAPAQASELVALSGPELEVVPYQEDASAPLVGLRTALVAALRARGASGEAPSSEPLPGPTRGPLRSGAPAGPPPPREEPVAPSVAVPEPASSPLRGRERTLDRLGSWLLARGAPRVAVVGVLGVGARRLAYAWAERNGGAFPGGVWHLKSADLGRSAQALAAERSQRGAAGRALLVIAGPARVPEAFADATVLRIGAGPAEEARFYVGGIDPLAAAELLGHAAGRPLRRPQVLADALGHHPGALRSLGRWLATRPDPAGDEESCIDAWLAAARAARDPWWSPLFDHPLLPRVAPLAWLAPGVDVSEVAEELTDLEPTRFVEEGLLDASARTSGDPTHATLPPAFARWIRAALPAEERRETRALVARAMSRWLPEDDIDRTRVPGPFLLEPRREAHLTALSPPRADDPVDVAALGARFAQWLYRYGTLDACARVASAARPILADAGHPLQLRAAYGEAAALDERDATAEAAALLRAAMDAPGLPIDQLRALEFLASAEAGRRPEEARAWLDAAEGIAADARAAGDTAGARASIDLARIQVSPSPPSVALDGVHAAITTLQGVTAGPRRARWASRRLGWARLEEAELRTRAGQPEAARAAVEAALAVARDLYTTDPDDRHYAALLCASLRAADRAGDPRATALQEAVAVARRQAGRDPSSPFALRNLSAALSALAERRVRASIFGEARTLLLEDIDVNRKLVSLTDGSARARGDLAVALLNLSRLLEHTGDWTGALDGVSQAFSIRAALFAEGALPADELERTRRRLDTLRGRPGPGAA